MKIKAHVHLVNFVRPAVSITFLSTSEVLIQTKMFHGALSLSNNAKLITDHTGVLCVFYSGVIFLERVGNTSTYNLACLLDHAF